MIHWSDMMAPVYVLCELAGVDPIANTVLGISVGDNRLIIRYKDMNNNVRHSSVEYEF